MLAIKVMDTRDQRPGKTGACGKKQCACDKRPMTVSEKIPEMTFKLSSQNL